MEHTCKMCGKAFRGDGDYCCLKCNVEWSKEKDKHFEDCKTKWERKIEKLKADCGLQTVRNAALEEAAVLAEKIARDKWMKGTQMYCDVAKAIRALKGEK